MTDFSDFTNKYNTELSPEETERFQSWAKQQPRDVNNEKYDYDIQGWWKANPGVDLGDGHLTDQWKKPNHPTFSDQSQYHGVDGNEGGSWVQNPDNTYTFNAGRTNFDHHPVQNMQSYFQKYEPGNQLNINNYPTEQGYWPAYMQAQMRQ